MDEGMHSNLTLDDGDFRSRSIDSFLELGAYEALWDDDKASFKRIAELFRGHKGAVPSDFVNREKAENFAARALDIFARAGVERFGVRVHGAGEYPQKLRDAQNPVELLYYQGWWDLVNAPSVAVVGARKASPEGIRRARKLAASLANDGYVVVSGLAAGIDAAAHSAALDAGGLTIAVIGTPLSDAYPKENAALQRRIAKDFLLISQVPVVRYKRQTHHGNRLFFPERNITMSALTEATVIVEASDTSGTLHQARAAISQRRKLFILESCFNNPAISWPHKFEKLGAMRVKDYEDIRRNLGVPGINR